MLVLSRKLGEKIFIGDNIASLSLTLIAARFGWGSSRTRNVPIYRQELLPLNNAPRPDTTQAAPVS